PWCRGLERNAVAGDRASTEARQGSSLSRRRCFRQARDLRGPGGAGVKYAIRIPSNENLERDIELLTRPVGRPSDKPVVWYKSFLYQAASWKTARRVVAKSRISLRAVVSPRGVHRDQPGDR